MSKQSPSVREFTLEQLIREIVRTHNHNLPECSAASKEFYSRALGQDFRVMPIWLHMLVREAKMAARAEEQNRIKSMIRKSP